MATVTEWFEGARPRTLPAALAPVIVGSGAAASLGGFALGRALLAAGVALALQVGVNYANDYSDGVRGTDLSRVGPTRLTASGIARPKHVRNAAFIAFGVAALLGLALVLVTRQWWWLGFGVAAFWAAWFYTGGKRPYGYEGLGEVMVFIFFGLVATLGTTVTQAGRLSLASALGAVAMGLLACALLMVNNIRDIPTDALAGKHTLAVRLGDATARRVYAGFIWLALACAFAALLPGVWALWMLLFIAPAAVLTFAVRVGVGGRLLVPVLAGTSGFQLAMALIVATGLALRA
ncbi:MAG: 1,4-dihydroxy-2-naphthoate polyprenyltransferase [Cellulomonadaceae bacterium]|jgi:1,4-dihydroxy-2-naphthoate octaprenyltransferase|nr:1,4-dihydroxy-2-naphthoate polyprenyltransferase [Cellulomonadaceae bacterium]